MPQVRRVAERNKQEAAAWAAAAGRLTEDERQLYSGDPVAALEYVIARSHALSARLTRIVDGLADGELRYKGAMGEQIHGALSAMQRSLKDTAAMSERAIGLGIDARRQRVQEEQLTQLTVALEATLAELGLDLAQQHMARHVLSRRLHAIEGGVPQQAVRAEVIDEAADEALAKARFHGPPVQ